jgi:exopolysaccharide production protein ExoZ
MGYPKLGVGRSRYLNSPQRTYLNVQTLRGISAVSVLLFHLASRELQDWPDAHGHLFHPFFYLSSVGVDLFFVVSGFVITISSLKDFCRPDRILSFLEKRFYRIYPIYWLTCLLTLATVASHNGYGWYGNLAALMLQPRYTWCINPVSWSLVHEVLFYAMFAFVMLAPARFLPVFVSLWAVGIGVHYFDPACLFPSWTYSEVLFSLSNFAFMFGIVIALFASINRVLFPRLAIIFGAGLLAFGAVVDANGYTHLVHLWPNRIIFIEVAAACIVYGAVGLEVQGTVWSSRILQTLGDASYSIYLAHYIVILAARPFYPSIHGSLPRICWSVTVFIVALGAGLLTYFCLERPMLRLFREKMSLQKKRSVESQTVLELSATPSVVGV